MEAVHGVGSEDLCEGVPKPGLGVLILLPDIDTDLYCCLALIHDRYWQ